jgi:hypothetical protein
MDGKTILSTALDQDTLDRLDRFCGEIHRTRAEILRGLLYALLVDGKQFVYEEWRQQVVGQDGAGQKS